MTNDLVWHGLNVGDWATWAGATGSILAAIAAAVAAGIALNIANQQARRESQRYDRRAETHAAYIFNEVALVYGYLEGIHALAAALQDGDLDSIPQFAQSMKSNAEEFLILIDRIPAGSIAELPDSCAAATAGAISASRMLILQATTLMEKWKSEAEDMQRTRRIGLSMVRRCIEIRTNFQPYLVYAKTHFKSDLA